MTNAKASCAEVPQFDRLTYFYGQMLHARDLQIEQAYFREKQKLHNRCLHGWGVVCGLTLGLLEVAKDCPPQSDAERARIIAQIEKLRKEASATQDETKKAALEAEIEALRRRLDALGAPANCAPDDPRTKLEIACGLALDCEGNEIVVRAPRTIDLWAELSPSEREALSKAGSGKTTLYVGVCYRECPIEPVRPVIADACGGTADCNYGKVRDGYALVVTTDGERWKDERCETCCAPCETCCVLLARIDDFEKGKPLSEAQLHLDARRMVSLRPATKIKGINWVHGGKYTPAQAAALLGSASGKTGGLEIQFTRPLRSETIVDGTFDVWVVEGGRGRAAGMFSKAGVLELPSGATADRVLFRDDTAESLNDGDRVLITLRSAFLLDACCRPVDGAHVGGRVPTLPGSPTAHWTPKPSVCLTPPDAPAPWTSGAGSASNFESWFWITRP